MSDPQTLNPLVLGRRLRHFRKEAGLTLDDLSSIVDRPAPYLSMVENGKKEPKVSLLVRLADALQTDVPTLLEDSPPTERDRLEIDLIRAQETRLFETLDIPTLKPSAKLDNETLAHLVGMHRQLREKSGLGAAGSEDVRRANGDIAAWIRSRNGYLAGVEEMAARALEASGYSGEGPFSSRNLLDLAAEANLEINPIDDMPPFARSIIDLESRRIYIAQRDELRTRQARKAVLQTLAGLLLDHEEDPDLETFLRQRVESAYFATAVLVPEPVAIKRIQAAKKNHDIDVEDIKELFYVSYEMAAWRAVNLLTHHFEIETHLLVSTEEGRVVKGYVNDGLPAPTDAYGGLETQRLCRHWGARITFNSPDRFDTHHQYTDTPGGTFLCTTHIEAGRDPSHAITLGVPFKQAKWFRGRETEERRSSTCPDPECCRLPSQELRDRWDGKVAVSARSQARILGLLAPDPYPDLHLPDVLRVVDDHSPDDG